MDMKHMRSQFQMYSAPLAHVWLMAKEVQNLLSLSLFLFFFCVCWGGGVGGISQNIINMLISTKTCFCEMANSLGQKAGQRQVHVLLISLPRNWEWAKRSALSMIWQPQPLVTAPAPTWHAHRLPCSPTTTKNKQKTHKKHKQTNRQCHQSLRQLPLAMQITSSLPSPTT